MTTVVEHPAPDAPVAPKPVRRARRGHRLIPALLVLAGSGVLAYPVVATLINDNALQEVAAQYATKVSDAPPADLARSLADARAYNETLDGIPILDPWLAKAARDPSSPAYRDYLSHLDEFEAMGRIRIPSINTSLPIYHGTEDDSLSKGVGHLYGSALPVGGVGMHSVLTAHTAFSGASLFDRLVDVKIGDMFYVDVGGETLGYQVTEREIVLPNVVASLVPHPGHDLVTLITCTPYAVNTHRLLVTGERVELTPEQKETATVAEPGWTMQAWMWWLLAAAFLSLLLLLIAAWRSRRRRDEEDDDSPASTR